MKNIVAEQKLDENTQQPNINKLSKREIEIAKLIKEGLTSKEIASPLGSHNQLC